MIRFPNALLLAGAVICMMLTAPAPAASSDAGNIRPAAATAGVAELAQAQEQRRQAEWAQAVAEAKLEIANSGNDRLALIIGMFGLLVTVLLVGFGIAAWKAAANAARAEVQDIRDKIETIRAQAALGAEEVAQLRAQAIANADETRRIRDTSVKISDELRIRLDTLPRKADAPPSDAVLKEAQELATSAASKPTVDRTLDDLKSLVFDAKLSSNWAGMLAFAREIEESVGADEEAIAFAVFNQAFALDELGRYPEAVAALERFCSLSHLSPEQKAGALYNWGFALDEMARREEGSTAENLWVQAQDRYGACLAIDPQNVRALNNLALTLAQRARSKEGEESEALLALALRRYEDALAINPSYHDALFNSALVLSTQAYGKTGERADPLRRSALERLATALASKPNDPVTLFQLARLSALLGDPIGAGDWLRRYKEVGRDAPALNEILAQDQDFGRVRDDPAFKAALAHAEPQ